MVLISKLVTMPNLFSSLEFRPDGVQGHPLPAVGEVHPGEGLFFPLQLCREKRLLDWDQV